MVFKEIYIAALQFYKTTMKTSRLEYFIMEVTRCDSSKIYFQSTFRQHISKNSDNNLALNIQLLRIIFSVKYSPAFVWIRNF